MDMESEIEDYGDRPKIWDGALWNRENRYGAYGRARGGGGMYNNYASVRNVNLNDLYPGRVQKRYDQSYTLNGYGGNVSDHDSGVLNRAYNGKGFGYGGYGGGYAANAYSKGVGPYGNQGGALYNKEKSYDNIRSSFRPANSRALPMTLTLTAVAETLLDMAAAVPSEAMATTWATAATAATEEATMEAALLLCSAVSTLQATKKKNQKLRP